MHFLIFSYWFIELREAAAELQWGNVWPRTVHDQATEMCDLSVRLNIKEKVWIKPFLVLFVLS